jgi:acetoin utilization deacetylase AcuC-like enzyme
MAPEVHYSMSEVENIDIGTHVFPTEKYPLVRAGLVEALHVPLSRIHSGRRASEEDLERVHTPRYVSDLLEARSTWATKSSELPVRADVIDGFRHMAGGSMAAVELAVRHGIGFHIGGGLHHAFPDHAEGFCYFHDMAIAVEWWRAEEGVEKVLFVDVDVHQGNGTAVIYGGDSDTFTYSIHQERNYPPKQRSDRDRGLEDGISDDRYLELLVADLERVDGEFEADLLCYVAGVDPHRDDVLGGLGLSNEGLLRRDRLVLERYGRRRIPIAIFLAGGYAPEPGLTADLHLQTARAAEELCTELVRSGSD